MSLRVCAAKVGATLGNGAGRRWKTYYKHFCQTAHEPYDDGNFTKEAVWNFLQTYVAPFGVQHGSDHQGGMHEGSSTRIVNGSNEYVSAFAVEGKLLKVANLWRASDIEENDDLVLELCFMPPQANSIPFDLCSSIRANRAENAPVPIGWWYLMPTVLKYKTIIEEPHIHIGRAQKSLAGYTKNKWGLGMPPWNARSCVVGEPLQMTFEPDFVDSDEMVQREEEEWILAGMTPGQPTQLSHECGQPPPNMALDHLPHSIWAKKRQEAVDTAVATAKEAMVKTKKAAGERANTITLTARKAAAAVAARDVDAMLGGGAAAVRFGDIVAAGRVAGGVTAADAGGAGAMMGPPKAKKAKHTAEVV